MSRAASALYPPPCGEGRRAQRAGVGVAQMKRSRNSSSGSDRIWASRDRTVAPPNRLRARAMRATPTMAERRLWWHLRHCLAVQGTHFRRQVHLGRYIVDFVSHDARLVIEVDGGQHDAESGRDMERARFLESQGYRVLRFWNNEVLGNIDGVLELIQSAIRTTPTPDPSPQGGGE
jgi:very-short-patch-repair endonuclease